MTAYTDLFTIERVRALEMQISLLQMERFVETAGPHPPTCGRIRRIVSAAAQAGEVSIDAVLGQNRAQRLFKVRAAAMWVAVEAYGFSTPHIGRDIGNRDHTTVLNALKRAAQLRDQEPSYRRFTDELLAKFQPQREEPEHASGH